MTLNSKTTFNNTNKWIFIPLFLLFISCTQAERNNPDDPDGIYYKVNQISSSTFVEPSSSSVSNPNSEWHVAFYSDTDNRVETRICANYEQGDLCGAALIDAEVFTVDFYMIDRDGGDTLKLANGAKDCTTGNPNNIRCFAKDGIGGITINKAVYSCGGYAKCNGTSGMENINVPSGGYVVYARLMEVRTGYIYGKPLSIDNIRSQ